MFTPDEDNEKLITIPFFEDSREEAVPGRGTKKTVSGLQTECIDLMLKLGAGAVRFTGGKFQAGNAPKRYGYQITFSMNGVPGRIEIAALPLRSETESKKDRALAQALYLFRNWLEAEVWSAIYRPGAVALLPFLTDEHGRTVTEFTIERGILPRESAYWLPPLLGRGE